MSQGLKEEDIKTFLVNDLKEELKKRNASTVGKKAELYDRLLELIVLENNGKNGEDDSIEDQKFKDENTSESEANKEDTINNTVELIGKSTEENDSKKNEVEINNDKEKVNESAIVQEEDNKAENNNTNNLVSSNETELKLKETVKQNLIRKAATAQISINTSSDQLSSSGGRFVRIDNFQRPLNVKSLLKWMEDTVCHFPILEENIWINSIKTHCYIDFESSEQAKLCIEKITGLSFPTTSTLKLEADYTTVSAKNAPTSAEASLKPGEWKSGKESVSKEEFSPSAPLKRKIEDVGVTGSGSMLKRAALLAATTTSRSNVSPTAGNAEGFMTRRHKMEMGYPVEPTQSTIPVPVVGLVSKATVPPPPPVLSMDDLFRKTVTKPALYWLPVSSEVVEKKLKMKLSSGNKRNA